MNLNLLKPEIQAFITQHVGTDVTKLALLKNPFPEVDFKEILNQIASKTKAREKLPTWFNTSNILFPSKISVEQTSSEKTAKYKSGIVSGKSLIDLSGGFGVDDFWFSKTFEEVVHCESDAALSSIARHNFDVLGAANIVCKTGDSTQIVNDLDRRFDVIYVDPSRRHDQKGKVFLLRDCEPNVPELIDVYFEISETVMIKSAPILDISAAVSELKNVAEIHIVSVDNEVKELLFLLRKDYEAPFKIITRNILKDSEQDFIIDLAHNGPETSFGNPKKYLYEPNAGLMKSGRCDAAGRFFGLQKLHPNSHLFTSDELETNFPGRIFRITKSFAYDKANMKTYLLGVKANVTVRNFPDPVDALRKKWKISDGGNLYCFFSTIIPNDKIVLLCAKI